MAMLLGQGRPVAMPGSRHHGRPAWRKGAATGACESAAARGDSVGDV